MLFYLIIILFIVLYSSYKISKTWFNVVFFYTFIWGSLLILYDLGLLNYFPLHKTTLLFISLSTFCLIAGFFTGAITPKGSTSIRTLDIADLGKTIEFFLIIFILLLFVRTSSIWIGLLLRYGSISNILESGSEIYNLSRHFGYGFGIPMPVPVDYIASFFAGLHVIKNGRITKLSIFTLFLVSILHIALLSRLTLILCFVIFLSVVLSYKNNRKIFFNFKKTFIILIFTLFLILLISVVVNWRELGAEAYSSPQLKLIAKYFPAFPSIYYYLTSGLAGFNTYVINNFYDSYPVPYTFAHFIRVLESFDSSISIPLYETTVYLSPYPTITATWLRALYHDFGVYGIMIIPYLIGFISYLSMDKLKRKFSAVSLALISHIYIILFLSFFSYAPFLRSWWYSLIVSIILSYIIDKKLLKINW